MLTVYPSNKMEDLVVLLKALQSYHDNNNILSPDTILVESKGIQHWLNLELAKIQGIAMNYKFQMPASFIWDLARNLLDSDEVPRQSVYRREILAWRIDSLMSSAEFISNFEFTQAFHYWTVEKEQPDKLKRFQLATKLGDVFEQYMMFRPTWLTTWEANKNIENETLIDKETEKWQSWLWQQLVSQEPCHPIMLQQKAIDAIADYSGDNLPKQIMIFAINTMAPQTLEFFNALSAQGQCNIHLFYLNPCVEFWGDIRSDKTMARQLREKKVEQWLADNEDDDASKSSSSSSITNSLLSNLGQQGKEFFNLLQEVKGYEISAFNEEVNLYHDNKNEAVIDSKAITTQTILSSIQRDILTLSEPEYVAEQPASLIDQSISISSSHSELREIHALHDYLLHLFNEHPDWKPQDVVVMCPAIEDYAPYIEAVFRRPWDKQETDDKPRLPCSIADRTLMNAWPLIGTLSDLLQLPDSRFEISKILDYLRLPAIQLKFGFESSELETIEWWLQEASIHWARDAEHKQQLADLEESSAIFTWQWGLERLLLGFAQSDSPVINNNRLLLPHVEGQQAVLLGRLMQLLERLSYHTIALRKSRTAEDWQTYLLELMSHFFMLKSEEQSANELIQKVVHSLAENTAQANYSHLIEYDVMRNYLHHHFSLPDSGNHFMTGQVTFCSMIPMRSIPFKVIAILGLNDGQFPRQSMPMSFDLMTQSQYQRGDRSRRGDDRYLFLEALISARNNLYLSYQGRDIHKNSERQPSLILKELMNYLEKCYGWKLLGETKEEKAQLKEEALHPFSQSCYSGNSASFDSSWVRMVQKGQLRNNLQQLEPMDFKDKTISLEQLVRFFDNPLKEFSLARLNLKFESYEEQIEDAEPFMVDGLTDYQIRDEFCESLLTGDMDDSEVTRLSYELSGHLPDSPLSVDKLDVWQEDAEIFSQAILNKGRIVAKHVSVNIAGIQIEAELNWLVQGKQLLLWRPARRKAKDDMRIWLSHLVAIVVAGNTIETQGLFFNKKEKKVETIILAEGIFSREAISLLEQLIEIWQEGLCKPALIHARLGKALLEKNKNINDFEALSEDPKQYKSWNKVILSGYNISGLDVDAYFQWFYPHVPELTLDIHQRLFEIYHVIYQQLMEM